MKFQDSYYRALCESRLTGLRSKLRISYNPPVKAVGTFSKPAEILREIVRLDRILVRW